MKKVYNFNHIILMDGEGFGSISHKSFKNFILTKKIKKIYAKTPTVAICLYKIFLGFDPKCIFCHLAEAV